MVFTVIHDYILILLFLYAQPPQQGDDEDEEEEEIEDEPDGGVEEMKETEPPTGPAQVRGSESGSGLYWVVYSLLLMMPCPSLSPPLRCHRPSRRRLTAARSEVSHSSGMKQSTTTLMEISLSLMRRGTSYMTVNVTLVDFLRRFLVL